MVGSVRGAIIEPDLEVGSIQDLLLDNYVFAGPDNRG